MRSDQPHSASFANRRSASLAAARAQLQAPPVQARSLLPVLGAAFLAACAGVATAATVILGGASLTPPSQTVHPPVSHFVN